MKFLSSLALLVVLMSCSSKKVVLKDTQYDLKGQAKLTIQFLKDKSTRADIGILSLSTKEDTVIIKKEEVGCGKGTEPGMISKFLKIESDPFIMIPKSMFKEFILVCSNPNFKQTTGDFYLTFKNLYKLTDGAPGAVLASDVKIELK